MVVVDEPVDDVITIERLHYTKLCNRIVVQRKREDAFNVIKRLRQMVRVQIEGVRCNRIRNR